MPEVNHRLVLYKQLSSARNGEELAEIRDDLLDRFGPLPDDAQNLIEVIRLKIRCRQMGIETVEAAGRNLVLRVTSQSRIDPARLLQLLQQPDVPMRVTPDHRIHLSLRHPDDALAESFGLLDLLSSEDSDAPREGESA